MAEKVVELVIGMLGYSAQEITSGSWGYCYFPVGPIDPRFSGGRVWVKVKVTAIENVRIQRDVIVANEQKGVKEHTPVELSYGTSGGGYQRVTEDYPLPTKDKSYTSFLVTAITTAVTTATLVVTSPLASRRAILLNNNNALAGADIYLGGKDVATSTTRFALSPKSSIVLPLDDSVTELYYYSVLGGDSLDVIEFA